MKTVCFRQVTHSNLIKYIGEDFYDVYVKSVFDDFEHRMPYIYNTSSGFGLDMGENIEGWENEGFVVIFPREVLIEKQSVLKLRKNRRE